MRMQVIEAFEALLGCPGSFGDAPDGFVSVSMEARRSVGAEGGVFRSGNAGIMLLPASGFVLTGSIEQSNIWA